MNILFILPSFPQGLHDYLRLPSLEFAQMSALLKANGFSTSLIDMKINNYTTDDLVAELPQHSKDLGLICIESALENHCVAISVINACKAQYPNVPIALRGEIATFIPTSVLTRYRCLDFCIRYEGELAILALARYLLENKDISDIENISYRKDDNEVVNNPRSSCRIDLNALPPTDRSLYDLSKYLRRDSETIVRSSWGCPGSCKFCVKTQMARLNLFNMERFCNEIEWLKDKGFESFFFSDDTFAFSDQRLREFSDEWRKRKRSIRWTSNIRIKDINDYKIKTMKELGAYRVFVGIETINSKSSAVINKNITYDEILRKISILRKYGMEFHASFIVGSPNDTEDDLRATEVFLEKLRPTLATFNQLKLFPGTEIYDFPEKYDIICPDPFWFEKDNWCYYPVIGTKNLPPDKIYYWSKRLLRKFVSCSCA